MTSIGKGTSNFKERRISVWKGSDTEWTKIMTNLMFLRKNSVSCTHEERKKKRQKIQILFVPT